MKKLYLLFIAFCYITLCSSAFSAKAASLSVSINPTDTVLYICQNNELLLNAIPSNGQAPYSFLWSGDVFWLNQTNASNVSFVCNIPGTYKLKVKVTDNLLSEAYDSVKIIVKPLPTMSISDDQIICQGNSVNMSASGPATIIWFDALDNLVGWGGSYSVSPAATTFYTVMGISNGCSVSEIINVDVTPSPVVNAGADDSICEGDDFTISDASASDYSSLLWSTGGDGSFSDIHDIHPIYSPGPNDIANGSVILTLGLDALAPCPDVADALTLTINPIPNITISNDTSVCEGFSASLFVSGADSYIWSTGENLSSIVVSPAVSTSYSVTGSSLGCSSVESVLVDVVPFPVLVISNDTTICESSSLTLSVSGATTYEWSTGSHSSSINVNPTSTISYSVTGYNGSCSSTADVNVTVLSLPVNAGIDQTICEGSIATLNVVGGNSWIWSTGETTSTINVSPTSTTTYQVTATDGICSNTDEVKIYVTPLPIVDAGDTAVICPGMSVQLDASGADTYIWSTGETNNSILVSPIISTTFYVTGTLAGCSAIDSVRVTVNDSIHAEAGADVSVCLGQSVILSASGGDNYLWETGETTSSIAVSPSSTTVYSVIVSKNGCVGMDSVSVFVNPLPLADAGADDSVCVGQSIALNATGGLDYLWSTGENSASITVNPVSSTQYFVTVSDGICSAVDSVLIITINYPSVNLGNDTLVCIGTEITFHVDGGTSYLWNTGCIAASIVDYPIDTTQYSVTVTYYGCSSSDTIVVNTIPAIVPSISEDDTICIGNSSILVAGGGDSYLWSTGETTSSISVSPLSSSSYWVTITQGSCSTWVNTDVFVQTTLPMADAGIDQTICEGDSAVLSASGGLSYFWDNGALTSSISVFPLDSTMYHVVVSDGICSASDSVRVNVNKYPLLTLDTALWICPGTIAFLSAGGADSYLWSTGETTPDIYPSPESDTVYSVSGTSNGCTSIDSIPVYHFGLPNVFAGNDVELCLGESATLVGSGDGELMWETGLIDDTLIITPDSSISIMLFVNDSNACVNADTVSITVHELPDVQALGDTIICQGLSVPIWAGGAESYLWSNGSTEDSLSVSPMSDEVFYVTGTNNFGCSNIDSVLVNVLPMPIAFAGNDTVSCSGNNVLITASGGSDYLWNTGETTASIIVHPVLSSVYIVTVSNGACSDVDTIIVATNPLPSLDAGSGIALLEGDTAVLNGQYFSTIPLVDISWSPASYIVDPHQLQVQIFPDTNTMFYFNLTDQNGCTGTDSVYVEVWPYGIYLIPGTDTVVCTGSELVLQSGILMGGTAPFQYVWTNDTIISSSDSSYVSYYPSDNSDIVLTVTDAEGYSASTTYHITTIKTPKIQIPDSLSTCRGNSISIVSNSIGVHNWSNGSNNSSIEFVPDSTMTLFLTVNNQGCIATDSTKINVLPLPMLWINQPDTICNGDSVVLIAHSDGQLMWENGNTQDTLVFVPESSASVSVQAVLNGCFANATANILVYPIPTLEISTNIWENEFVDGQIIEITVKPDGYLYYSLYYGNDMYGNQSGIFNLHPPFVHDSITVSVISEGGCSADTSWQIELRKIPNGFTPNGDGINDVFMPGTELTIINRWGQEVFSGVDGWDGKVNGEMSTPGTYYFIIVIRDEFGNVLNRINGDLLLIKQN